MVARRPIITIDGPSGAGKSSVSKALAAQLGFTYLDTGAMFRAVALAAHLQEISWSDEAALSELLRGTEIGFVRVEGDDHVTLSGRDVEAEIRHPEISHGASQVAVHPSVRTFLLDRQRALCKEGGVILEGRDTGSVVFPDADVKIFLEASAQERAKRRLAQLGPESGESLESIQASIEARDETDSQRKVAPLLCPEGAFRVDASSLSLSEVVEHILFLVKSESGKRT